MAALSVFFMQSPSFLAHQRALAEGRARSNAHTLFGLDRIPCDNHIRQLLDGVPPAHFDAQFHAIVENLDAHGALAPMRRLDGRVPVALDGTGFFRSRKLHCPNCSTRKRGDGGTEYFHQMLAATVVAPGHDRPLPLPPEFVAPRDGAAKQDCERQAVKRWLERHGPRCAALRPVHLGDDLYACQPVCRAMLDSGGDFLLTAKPASHKTLCEYLDGIRPPTRRTTAGIGARRRIHRARWKIENETFNVLKQHGYHLEHNFGHGKDTLASVLVVLNLLAFALHGACELAETLWQRARRRLFEHPRTVTEYQVFPDWNALLSLLATGGTASQPP